MFVLTRPTLEWYFNGMRTTIDKAGRVVIPALIRSRAGLAPGNDLDVTIVDGEIRIQRLVPRAKLVRSRGRLVARPSIAQARLPDVDIAALVREERDR